MASSQVLEVSVGLMFIYLLLSAVCSGTKELMARALDMRANTLEKAIRNMLADPGGSITSKLIQNHLIAGMVEPGTKPSYISSRNFALALFDVIAPTNACQSKTVQDLKNGWERPFVRPAKQDCQFAAYRKPTAGFPSAGLQPAA